MADVKTLQDLLATFINVYIYTHTFPINSHSSSQIFHQVLTVYSWRNSRHSSIISSNILPTNRICVARKIVAIPSAYIQYLSESNGFSRPLNLFHELWLKHGSLRDKRWRIERVHRQDSCWERERDGILQGLFTLPSSSTLLHSIPTNKQSSWI